MPFTGAQPIPARFTSTMPTVVPVGGTLKGASLRLELDLSDGAWDEFGIVYAASRIKRRRPSDDHDAPELRPANADRHRTRYGDDGRPCGRSGAR